MKAGVFPCSYLLLVLLGSGNGWAVTQDQLPFPGTVSGTMNKAF